MKTYGGIFNGTVLILLGLAFGWYVLSGEYWRLMNPSFQVITGIAAGILLLVGCALLFSGPSRIRLSRAACLAAIIGIIWLGESAAVINPDPKDPYDGKSRITLDNKEYIKINIGELYLLLQQKSPEDNPKLPQDLKNRYVLRAVVKHHPDLKKNGYFMLMRSVVWCCLADATGTGFRVRYDKLDELEDGSWVQVYGKAVQLPKRLAPIFMRLEKTLVSWISPDFIIIPDRIKKISSPAYPYIFERETQEPYNY